MDDEFLLTDSQSLRKPLVKPRHLGPVKDKQQALTQRSTFQARWGLYQSRVRGSRTSCRHTDSRLYILIIPTQCFYRFSEILIGPLAKSNCFYTSIKPMRRNI